MSAADLGADPEAGEPPASKGLTVRAGMAQRLLWGVDWMDAPRAMAVATVATPSVKSCGHVACSA
jgi:hypothetical protein